MSDPPLASRERERVLIVGVAEEVGQEVVEDGPAGYCPLRFEQRILWIEYVSILKYCCHELIHCHDGKLVAFVDGHHEVLLIYHFELLGAPP